MATVDLILPRMGESIMEATILKWLKKPGDTVMMDETVLEVATDKVDSEVPSNASGVIEKILFAENDVVPIGTVIAIIRTQTGNVQTTEIAEAIVIPNETITVKSSEPYKPTITSTPIAPGRFYSPLVLNIASSEGIPLSELEKLPGTGSEGRVTKKDILEYVAQRNAGSTSLSNTPITIHTQVSNTPTQENTAGIENVEISTTEIAATPSLQKAPAPPPSVYSGRVEVVEMDRMRKLIADHMVMSKHTSPHVTSFSEADVTHMVQWRNKMKNEFEKRESTKLTFTPLLIEAIIKCIKKFPLINSSLQGNTIVIKKDINIGMATALPSGNLIVPVIKNADQLNLAGIARQVNLLAESARTGKLKADDIQDGTFTFTNVGTFGSLMGTPIINQPQVAIMAAGVIKKRPVVIENPEGDSIAIRHMIYLSMSYDHRIIDGSLGATFVAAVARELENFDKERSL